MNDLVVMKNHQAVTSSLQVAKAFGKQHYHVLETIEEKISSPENSGQYEKMFVAGTYKDRSGKSNKIYYMNRDGFTFIAMGFTGRQADRFKLQYISQFNQMESQLQELQKDSYMIDDRVLRATKWIDEEKERERLKDENQKLQIPALLGNAVSGATESIPVGTFAKVLAQSGVKIGQNRLFKWLRGHGYLISNGRRYNAPTQKAVELGVLEVRESVISTNHGNKPRFTPLVTGKGQQYFASKFLAVAVAE